MCDKYRKYLFLSAKCIRKKGFVVLDLEPIKEKRKAGRPKGAKNRRTLANERLLLKQIDKDYSGNQAIGRPHKTIIRRDTLESLAKDFDVDRIPTRSGGRPVGTHESRKNFMALVRRNAEKAMNLLIKIMENPETSDKHRIVAAKEILDRAYGKAPTAVINIDADSGSDEQKKLVVEFVKSHMDLRDDVKTTIIDNKPPIIEVNPIEDRQTDDFDRSNIVDMPTRGPASG